jgi:glycerophosphoryl diester phosphodiesterase
MWLVHITGVRIGLLLLVLGGITSIAMLVNAAIDFAAVSVLCLVVGRFYQRARQRLGLPVPQSLQQEASSDSESNWSLGRSVPLIVAGVALALTAGVMHEILERIQFEDHVAITAHRGASLVAPENSLSAVRRAIADGATHVEVDVQRTADGVLVLNHDADLMRVAQVPLVITQSTYEQLRAVDIGGRFGAEFAGERLATLDDVIQAARGSVKLVVELKSYKGDATRLVADVVQALRDQGLTGDSVVMSLKYDEVREVKRRAPEIVSGFVASASLGDILQLDADFLAISKSQATDARIAAAHAQGKQVYVWTVDDPREMSLMIDRGVDNIITNDPALAVRVLQQRADLTTEERILLRFKSLYAYLGE